MSITDELREWAEQHKWGWHLFDVQLNAIADRIDAEHERQCAESWMRGHDAWAAIDRSDDMAEHGWIRLPKDADGEYIHIGDEVETTNFGTVEVEGFVHRAVAFYNYSEQPAYLCTTPANLCRHYHAPTVEDVLTDFGIDWEHESDCEDRAALLKEYASKLQLKEDE